MGKSSLIEGGKKNKYMKTRKSSHVLPDKMLSSRRKMKNMPTRTGIRADKWAEGGSKHPVKAIKSSKPAAFIPRKNVDPQTAKYFFEIGNLFESNATDLDEISTICSNALEEARGKEFELCTDTIISHTLQKLVERCDLDKLCNFLYNCLEFFPMIAMDKAGSHVAEASLKSLAANLDNEYSHKCIEDILDKISKVVSANAVNLMHSCYGSHVVRALLCLCKGVSLDYVQNFHATKKSVFMAERFAPESAHAIDDNSKKSAHGFANVFQYLVREMLANAKNDISTLRVDKYGSFVLQTVLRLSVGNDEELHYAISCILDYDSPEEITLSGKKQELMMLLEDTASSHLLEVMIEVAPTGLYTVFIEAFRGELPNISTHPCGNFVAQALVSSTRTKDHLNLIWEELGAKMRELLELGKSGVVASILAASHRLETIRLECSLALAAVVCTDGESPSCIVPRILYLESFLKNKSDWKWPLHEKMSIFGCLMLQSIFRFPHLIVRPYVESLLSMDDNQIIQVAKDSRGSHFLESFLASGVSAKRKFRVIAKLQGHYGEIAMIPSSSFMVEKCFTTSNMSHKEAIAAELVAVRADLTKTKHGIHLLKKLEIDGYVRRPEQWRSSHISRTSAVNTSTADTLSDGRNYANSRDNQVSSPTSSKKKPKHRSKTDADAGLVYNPSEEAPPASAPASHACEPAAATVILPGSSQNNRSVRRVKTNRPISSKDSEGNKLEIVSAGGKPFLSSYCKRKAIGFVSDRGNPENPKRQKSEAAAGSKRSAAAELANLATKGKLSGNDVRKLFNRHQVSAGSSCSS